jgi:arylsulfatase A-like enzyme
MPPVSRRGFLKCSSAAISSLALPRGQAAPRYPNIVYILADDLGYGDARCYNPDSKVPTPNLDRLASQGVRFTDAHSPSAVCTPTRYGINTGRYSWRSRLKSGVLEGYSPALIEPGRLTVAAMLKQQGYQTAGIGKWHLGLQNGDRTDYTQPLRPGPLDAGFDYWFGIPASLDMPPYLFFENDRATAQPTAHVDGIREHRGVFWREGAIAPGFRHIDVLPTITKKAVSYLAGRKAGQPFFLYLALTAPHTPWLPTEEFRGKAKAGEYGDFVAMVDDAAGQVLHAIDRYNLASDTLVIMTSDNGAHWLPEEIVQWHHRANDGLRGQKADIWDGGHRIPFIARWPGHIQPSTVCGELSCLTDLFATAAEITGFKLPDKAAEDSYSMLHALLGKRLERPIREAIVHHSSRGHFSIRQGPWKLNIGRGSGGFTPPFEYTPKPGEPAGELFNMADDLAETRNLYLERPEIVARLTGLLEKYQQQGYSRPVAGRSP